MICTRHQLMGIIKRSLEQASPEEKRLLRGELERSLMQPPTPEDLDFLHEVGVSWGDK
jgi:hypothetical protein